MTDRITRVIAYVNHIFDNIVDPDERRDAYIHSYGVSHCCALLAAKRSLNAELATAIGLLHDVFRYKTGISAWHSQNGAEMIRVAFKYALKDLFTEEEQTIIKSAIYHHANKNIIHDEYDELLKDSDILQRLSLDNTFGWYYGQRLLSVMNELSLQTPKITILAEGEPSTDSFSQSLVGDIAERLANKHIIGDRLDSDYLNIIRYYPEESAFDELYNAWCAAFVYHCCLEAGLALPIRVPHTADEVASYRFACVKAWYEWGMDLGYCYFENEDFEPQHGDIVIYNNILARDADSNGSAECDHMGIVISCHGNQLMVAEGNADNRNVSAILSRKRDHTIYCYIRIPENYSYDGWKIDYKTGKQRIEHYEAISLSQD